MIEPRPSAYEVKLPLFEGPLDLLLHLIERQELDITRVSLATVTAQYLEYLAVLERVEPDTLADFLVVAAKLILIKSQALLPRPPETSPDGEDDVGDDLVQQLITYKQFKQVAAVLGDVQALNRQSFVRIAPPPKIESNKVDLSGVTIDDLLTLVRQALTIEKAKPPVGAVVKPFTLTIRDQIGMLQNRLQRESRLSFRGLLVAARSRVEIVVTFLALLELLKRRAVRVEQAAMFGDITITQSDEPPLEVDDEPLMDEYDVSEEEEEENHV